MRAQYKKTNEVVFKKGTTVQKLLILMEGKLKKFRSPSYLAEAGQTWGEIFLHEGASVRLEDDIIVETESVIIELNLANLRSIQPLQPFPSEKMKVEPMKIDYDNIKFINYIDKGLESSIIMASYKAKEDKEVKNLIGKLFHKA